MADNDVNRIGFTQGFSSWHVSWPITDVTKNDVKSFETRLKSQSGQKGTTWELHFIVVKTEGDNPLGRKLPEEGIWLYYQYGSLFDWILSEDHEAIGTAIVRVALCVGDSDPVFGEAFSIIGLNGPHLQLPVKELKPGDRATVHAWIDIPNAVVKRNKRKWEQCEEVGVAQAGLLRNVAGMFKVVVGEDDDLASFSDVTLVLKKNKEDPGRRFLCHRNVLAARSTVFLRMFANKQWKEGANKDERMVEITDIDEETMEEVLRFMYTGSLPDKDNNISNIIYAADKYQVADLKQWCVEKMIFDFNTDTDRLHQLLLADRHQLDELKAVCIACLTTNPIQFKRKELRSTLSDDLWAELWTAIAKRDVATNEISL